MTIYYRTTDGRSDINLTQAQFDALAPNKRANLRVYIVDQIPAATLTQVPGSPVLVVGPVEAHLTYPLRNKTAGELESEALAVEATTNAQLILDVKTQLDITNATFNALTDPQKIAVLRDDRRLLLRAVRYLLRRQVPLL
jgi:hypothetical protein